MADSIPNERRPWSVPDRPWAMEQKWHDLLFMHWPVKAAAIRSLIPSRLEIDLYDGMAWIGVVPFRMSGVRARGTPPVPGISAFPELNVRTYVRSQGKPGVWFFSLDAASVLAVAAARLWFHLPYFRAQMSLKHAREGGVAYYSHRVHRGAPCADLRVDYAPTGKIFEAALGTIDYFLCERYCLYAAHGARVYRGEIHHAPWPLEPAEAQIAVNTMAAAAGIELPDTKPLLHFARYQSVRVWLLEKVQD